MYFFKKIAKIVLLYPLKCNKFGRLFKVALMHRVLNVDAYGYINVREN